MTLTADAGGTASSGSEPTDAAPTDTERSSSIPAFPAFEDEGGMSFEEADALADWLEFDQAPVLRPLPPDPLGADPFAHEAEVDDRWGEPAPADWLPEEEDDDWDRPNHLPSEILATVEPGLFLAGELEDVDCRSVDEYHLVEVIAGYHRLASWAQARMTEVAGRLSRRPALNPQAPFPGGEYVTNVTAEEIAPRLGLSRFAARQVVENAEVFSFKLQDTATALHEGRIDYAKATTMARMLKDQPGDVAWEVEQLVLPDASHQTHSQLVRAINKAIIAIDPHRATARHRRAKDGRRVDHPRPLPDGMTSLFAILPATDAAGLDLALEAAARAAKAAGDTRTIDQLRADALALLGHAALDHGFIGQPADDPTGHGPSGSEAVDHGTAEGAGDSTTHGASDARRENNDSTPGPAGETDHPRAGGFTPGPAGDTGDSRAAGDDPAAGSGAKSADPSAAGGAAATTGDTGQPRAAGDDPAAGPGAKSAGPPAAESTPAPDLPDPWAPDHTPVLDPGGSFLRTPHMPIGAIGGRRAQVQVTVPLSVLIPPELLNPHSGPPGDSCAHSSTPPAHEDSPPVDSGQSGDSDAPPHQGSPPGGEDFQPDDGFSGEGLADEDFSGDGFADLPEDWYEGPVPAEVAELEGYGPITPDVARALALNGGTWQRLVTDPLSGELLDVGRTRYKPPAALADFVRTRDGTCVRPGCSSPARICQLDHVQAWDFGGVTSAENLASLCERDHITKTLGAFQLQHLGGGTFTWTTPSGHHYRRDHTGRITPLRRTPSSSFGDEPPF